MTLRLQAFFNDPKLKQHHLKQVKAHYKLDQIVKGRYWQNGKGCAVGCLVHSKNHIEFETKMGIPEWIAHLIDYLFESLDNGSAKEFPVKFIQSVEVGANYDLMYHEFCLYLLENVCQWNKEKYPDVTKTIDTVLQYHRKTVESNDVDIISDTEWSAAESAAWSAEGSAARSAAWSATRSAAGSAAWSATRSAEGSAARSAAVKQISEKLLELLKKWKPESVKKETHIN